MADGPVRMDVSRTDGAPQVVITMSAGDVQIEGTLYPQEIALVIRGLTQKLADIASDSVAELGRWVSAG